MNTKQSAIVRQDLKAIVFDKRQFPVILIVPAVFTLVLPTLFILLSRFGMDDLSDMQNLIDLLPVDGMSGDDPQFMIGALLNYIMPIFFMMIPIMAAMVMAASSFVGEKEKSTLETLLYSPLSLKQIFQAKIFASFILSVIVSIGSFLVMLLVVETEILLLFGSPYIPSISWLINLLLVSPAVSMICITLIVRGSAKAQTVQESQQRAVFLILPVMLLIVGQFTGIFLVGPLLLLGLGIFFALIAFLLMKGAIRKFTYETLLK